MGALAFGRIGHFSFIVIEVQTKRWSQINLDPKTEWREDAVVSISWLLFLHEA